MSHSLNGNLSAFIGHDCRRPVVRGTLHFYSHASDQNEQEINQRIAAQPKFTYRVVSREQANSKEARLVGVAHTDENGNYELTLSDKRYRGGALEVDLRIDDVHGAPPVEGKDSFQATLASIAPNWRESDDSGPRATWSHQVDNKLWCSILAHFDLWVICGRVETCKGHAPIALAKVEGFDKDFTQDDSLGTATTDNNGHFVLYYRTQDFTKTPFSPLINLELQHGPDVYFRAELAGQPIIEESRLVGLQTGRRNVPRCAQVTLCTERVDPTSPESTPHWELIEDFDVDAQIDANGFAGTKKYVFCDVVKMRGNMPLLNVANNKPLKYRFMVGAYKWPGAENPAVLPTIPPTDVELAPVPAAAINGVVGMLYYTDSDATEKATAVHLGPADVDADGCVQLLGKVVSVQLSDMTTQLIALSTTNFVDYDVLEQINFSYLEKPGTNTGTVENFANPGAAVPAAQRAPTRRYKLVFQVYDNDQTPTQVHATKVLNAAVIDSSAVKVGLMLTELESNLCQKITDEVHIKYTIDHPHLDDFKVEISKNSGVQHPAPPLPDGHFAGNISFRGGQSAPGGAVVDVSGDPSCAYRCRLSFDTRHYDSSRGAGRHVELLYAK